MMMSRDPWIALPGEADDLTPAEIIPDNGGFSFDFDPASMHMGSIDGPLGGGEEEPDSPFNTSQSGTGELESAMDSLSLPDDALTVGDDPLMKDVEIIAQDEEEEHLSEEEV